MSLGMRPAEEVVLHDAHSLDFVVEWYGDRLGIEVDGRHMCVNTRGLPKVRRRNASLHIHWLVVPDGFRYVCVQIECSDEGEKRTRRAVYARSLPDSAVLAS